MDNEERGRHQQSKIPEKGGGWGSKGQAGVLPLEKRRTSHMTTEEVGVCLVGG